MTNTLLKIRGLNVHFRSSEGVNHAVRDVSFNVGREKVAIVGESGSGKSQTGRAIMRLTPSNAQISAQKMLFTDVDLLRASEASMLRIRGKEIGMILQDPKFSLNPLMRVGDQIVEAYRLHFKTSASIAKEKTLEILNSVNIRDASHVFSLYPHQVSGGMGQRIMIAMMLILEPKLIIADEPTSALDVTVKAQVLEMLNEQVRQRNMGLILISHDLNLVAEFCDRVLVMYKGRIMEELKANELDRAQHPYTQALLNSLPRLDRPTNELTTMTRDPSWIHEPTLYDGVFDD